MKSKQKQKKEDNRNDPEALDRIIKSFLVGKDVASWFRGTSIFHLRGSNELLEAIRDDSEQRTTHRVKRCLTLIGIEPMISPKDISMLMNLSQGSDLAFLWFLLELHYKIPDTKSEVGLNQQLICSAIAHLDMIPTLRELDKILPINDAPQRKTKSAHTNMPSHERLVMDEIKRKPYVSKYVLPYFEKQVRPKVYGKPVTVNLPNYEVNFYEYESYKDPHHRVLNEANRWFANYDFHPGRRVAAVIIKDAISEIFQNFEAAKLKADTIKVLCKNHRAIKELEENKKRQLLIERRNKLLYGLKKEKDEYRRRLLIESLDAAVEDQLCQFRKHTTKVKAELTLKTLTSDSNITSVLVGSEYDECCSKLSQLAAENSEIPKAMLNGAGDASAAISASKSEKRTSGAGDFNNTAPSEEKSPNANPCTMGNYRPSSEMSLFASKYLANHNYEYVGATPTPSKTFFTANTKNCPLQFDYRKIFLFQEDCVGNDGQNCIKKAFLEALDKDIATLNELEVARVNLNSAASECAEKTWQMELDRFNAEHQNDAGILITKPHPDPEDKKLMDQMLSDAFEILRKNPKYVLAQLPNVHKLPILREWIYRRYGKVYTPDQRYMSCRYSAKVFQALDRQSFNIPTPTSGSLGRNQVLSYGCRSFLEKKVKDVKTNFYQRLDNAVLEQSRNYWFNMRAYLCSNGPPRNTFFAYMPSRSGDIQHFRLWRKTEYRPDKEIFDKRWRMRTPR